MVPVYETSVFPTTPQSKIFLYLRQNREVNLFSLSIFPDFFSIDAPSAVAAIGPTLSSVPPFCSFGQWRSVHCIPSGNRNLTVFHTIPSVDEKPGTVPFVVKLFSCRS